ncbi:MAG TPA: YggT family protein [Acidimicrobiales bacterium]|nr:YggT family protein [Acidimicrobiales bacterium]
MSIFDILVVIIEIYVIVLIVRALLSWFPASPGSALSQVNRALDRVTEPVLRPVRRILPPVRAGGMAIDLSILVVILVCQLILIPVLRH